MNEDEAELLGMHAGDGTLYRTSTGSIVWELRGGLDEQEYYHTVVVPLFENVFDIALIPHRRTGGGDGSFGVRCCKKKVTSFLAEFFPIGSKSRIVRMPQQIKLADVRIQAAFLRGVFDTDGCFWLGKNHTRQNVYPRVEVSSASPGMAEDISAALGCLGIHSRKWQSGVMHRVCIHGWANLALFSSIIGFHNPKHLNKVKRAQAMRVVMP